MDRAYALTALALIVAMLGGLAAFIFVNSRQTELSSCSQSTIAGGAGAIGGPFELVSETGETVTDLQVVDKPTLIYFGYTFCPDVCSFDASRNAEAVELLAEQGVDAKPVFISIDPERDTPEVLSEWTDYLHPEMLGLTGSPEQIKAASQAYRTYYKRQPSNDEFYLLDHSTFTYLVLPEQGFVEFFRRDATAPQIAETVACFAKAAS